MNTLDNTQKRLGYSFKKPAFLRTALTHRSYLNEDRSVKESNERLEFLGDAVLEIVVSEFLFHTYPELSEGKLTSLRAKIVQTKTLASVAIELNLGTDLSMSRGEAASGGANNASILADTYEAVIGAVYLDGGMPKASELIKNTLLNNYRTYIASAEVEDWKSKLQELIQSKGGIAPTYDVVREEGPDHDRTFTVQVMYFDKPQETGSGRSKQAAQQEAAKKALEKFESLE